MVLLVEEEAAFSLVEKEVGGILPLMMSPKR